MKILSTLMITLSLAPALLPAPALGQALPCNQVPALMNVFLGNHYSMNQLTPELKSRTVSLFLKYIDPNKQLFLKSDIERMKVQLGDLFTAMSQGNCAALGEIGNLFTARSEENLKIVGEILKPNFAIKESVRYQTNTKKRDHPVDAEQRRSAIEDAVQIQVATIVAGDVKLPEAKKQLKKRYELAVKRAKEMKLGKMINLFAESFAHALDPHSDYLSPEQLDEFRISMGLSLEGIGVSLSSEDGYTVVQEIIPGGSADRDGRLKPKDRIIEVAQDKGTPVSIIDMDLSDVVKMIRGKKGTKVRLKVQRKTVEQFYVDLVRDKVDMKEQAAKVDYQTRKVNGSTFHIAVIDLPSFYGGSDKNSRDCYEDMKAIVKEAVAKKVDGIILDLSTDGGGLLQDAVRIAGLFIKNGPVVATMDGKGNREILADDDSQLLFNGPFMIVTTRQSASASEILAGAMKDHKRALIVGGDHTYGKGTVQVLNPLPFKLGAMKLTTQMFYLPGGASTQHDGVSSDIVLPTYLDSEDLGEQYMDYALPASKTKPFLTAEGAQGKQASERWSPITEDLIQYLRERSSKRVAQNAEFKDILKDLEDFKKNEGWVKVSDILKRSDKDKEKRKERKDLSATVRGRKELWIKDPRVQEAIAIMTDWLSRK
jgi:carboxyl-terminal processing protease